MQRQDQTIGKKRKASPSAEEKAAKKQRLEALRLKHKKQKKLDRQAQDQAAGDLVRDEYNRGRSSGMKLAKLGSALPIDWKDKSLSYQQGCKDAYQEEQARITPAEIEKNKGYRAGYKASWLGYQFRILDNQSPSYQAGYEKGYQAGQVNVTPEQIERNKGYQAGHKASWLGEQFCIPENQSPSYQAGYREGYQAGQARITPEQAERNKGRVAGNKAARFGYQFRILENQSTSYQEGYREGYEKTYKKLSQQAEHRLADDTVTLEEDELIFSAEELDDDYFNEDMLTPEFNNPATPQTPHVHAMPATPNAFAFFTSMKESSLESTNHQSHQPNPPPTF